MVKLGIVTVVQNERRYLAEWLAFNRDQGVERFIVFDNNSTDGTPDYLRTQSDVLVIDWPQHPAQFAAWNHVIDFYSEGHHLLDDWNWAAFVDVDEFLHNPQGRKLPEVLERYESEFIGSVVAHWVCYGTSNQQQDSDEPVSYRFTKHASEINPHVKSIVRIPNGSHKIAANPHRFYHLKAKTVCVNELGEIIPDDVMPAHRQVANELRINHYVTKSWPEMMAKARRIRPDVAQYRDVDAWIKEQDRNDVSDHGYVYQWGKEYRNKYD